MSFRRLALPLLAAAVATPLAAHAASSLPVEPAPVVPAVTETVSTVGPAVSAIADQPAAAPVAASGGSQMVIATVASTTGVSLNSDGEPAYSGTEPAYMTVRRDGETTTITIVPQ